MFEFVKVHDIKGINKEGVILSGLGKINIICGKNNSGKTSLLEGINLKEKSEEGRKLETQDIDIIFTIALRGGGWASKEPNSPEGKLYKKIIEDAATKKEVWFSDEEEIFSKEVRDIYRQSQLRNWAQGSVGTGFNTVFNRRPKTVLLPPKRLLELSINVNNDQNIGPQGIGILNYLFFVKNRATLEEDNNIFQSISHAFEEVSNGYKFDIIMQKGNQLTLRFRFNGKPWIDASNCGLGLQDLLVMLYFSIHPDNDVILIEEPESHLHPDLQKKLLFYLKNNTEKQFFLSTHSNIFLNNALIDRVFFTSCDEYVKVDDATSRSSILNNLGYSVADNLMSDLVILVEGPKDTPIIQEFLIKYGLSGKYDIKTWPIGGDIMDQLDLSVFTESHPIIALIDNDPGSKKTRDRFKAKCAESGIELVQLERYSIENYFTLDALKKVFGDKIPSQISDLKHDKKLEDQLGFDVKKSNGLIAKNMVISDIDDTDLGKFFHKVKDICSK